MYSSVKSQVQKRALAPAPPANGELDGALGLVELLLQFVLRKIRREPAAAHRERLANRCPTRRGSNATPAFPAAERMRPQFGSEPAIAVFTSGEFAIDRAIFSAARSLVAPSTSMVTSFCAPSPSLTICRASDSSTSVSAVFEGGQARAARPTLRWRARPTCRWSRCRRPRKCGCSSARIARFSAARSASGAITASVITNAERGRHARMNHAGAFGHAGDPRAFDLRERGLHGQVGGHDGARRVLETVRRSSPATSAGQRVDDQLRVQFDADHSGRCGQHFFGFAPMRFGRRARRFDRHLRRRSASRSSRCPR